MPQDIIALVHEQWDAWNAHDVDTVVRDATEDVIQDGDPLPQTLHGRDALRQFAQMYFDAFPDLHFELGEIFVSGDAAVSPWTATGTQRGALGNLPPTGRSATVRGCNIFRFRDGKLAHSTAYWDQATLLRQLGAIPAQPEATAAPREREMDTERAREMR